MLVTLRVKGLNLMLQSTLQGKVFANPCKMIKKSLSHFSLLQSLIFYILGEGEIELLQETW